MASWRKFLTGLGGFNFFAAKGEREFLVLAITGMLFILPFSIINFAQGRHLIGAVTSALVLWFMANGIALYRGRRFTHPAVVFLPALGVLAFALWARGELAIFWAFPAVLLFHFILERRVANVFNASIVLMAAPAAYLSFGTDVAVREATALTLTIVFANVFSSLIERQQRRAAAQERELALERDRLALLVHATRAGFTEWDAAANAVIYSERFKEMLGYPRDADTSAWPPFFEMLHPEDRARVQERFDSRLRGKRTPGLQEPGAPIEYRLRRADGSYVWVHAQSLSQVDGTGKRILRYITSFQDISKFREQDEALRESVRLREEVERMSRHDLKTPLNSIIAVPRLLREGRKLDSEERELLSIVERAGYRILNMINLSIDLFRMEQGSYTFRPQVVSLDELVRKVVADLESQADSKQIAIRIETENNALARGEELLCYSMLANLVKNAVEASPEGGTVTVTIESKQGALIHIHNAGAVPEAVRDNFFEKYSTAGKPGGLGLGTYSALLMARVQEGNITMRTSAEAGTTLTVRLAEPPAGALPAASDAPSAGDRLPARMPQLPPLDVLVVDDDEFNRLVMRRYLPSPPLNVAVAVNGRAAIEALRRQPYDFVFLDLEMPVMTGYEAAARIRRLEREKKRKPTTLVAFSSNDDEASIRRALAAGCDHYLVKPAPRETLWKLLNGGSVVKNKIRDEKAPGPSDPVQVDIDLRPTLPAFFVSRREALDEIELSLARAERPEARRLAHKLAGSFSLYGFKWAAAQCKAIERAAESGDPGDLGARVVVLRQHLDSAEVRFVESAEPAA